MGGADGLVGGEDPHAADAARLLVALAEGHVIGLLHHELQQPCLYVLRLRPRVAETTETVMPKRFRARIYAR